MFHDDDGVASFNKSVQNTQQMLNVDEVQSGRRFVENIDRFAGRALAEFFR